MAQKQSHIGLLHRGLSVVAGQADLPDRVRTAAGEAAMEDDPSTVLSAIAEAWLVLEAEEARLKMEAAKIATKRKAGVIALEALRAASLQYLDETGARQDETPEFVIKRKPGVPGVQVTDISKIPDRFKKTPEPEVRLAELKTAVLKDGEVIEGVVMTNGQPYAILERKRHAA